jgi:hypothetical protein
VRQVDFNALPRTTREAFVAALRSPHSPLVYVDRTTTGAVSWWGILLLVVGGLGLLTLKDNFGSAYGHRQGAPFLLGYVVGGFLLALAAIGILRHVILSRGLPYTPGRYVVPLDVVIAKTSTLEIYSMTDLLHLQPTHHYRNGIYSYTSLDFVFREGKSFSFTIPGQAFAEHCLARMRHGTQTIAEAARRQDLATLAAFDPFFDARARDFAPVSEPGPVAKPLPAFMRFRWAIAGALGVLLAVPTFFVRNYLSDEKAYRGLDDSTSTYTLEAYAHSGGRHADDVRRNLVPRAHLKKAVAEPREKRVEAVEKFLKDFPASVVEKEAQAALVAALHEEFLARTTVTELREFLKKWPSAADAPAAKAQIHALYEKTFADFKSKANPNDKSVVPVVESLVGWMEDNESPPLPVRFRRKSSPSLAAADKLLAKGLLDDDGQTKGGNAEVSGHFTEAKAIAREDAAVRALEHAFRQVFPADILPLKRGEALDDGEKVPKSVTSPLIRVDYEVAWSGSTYVGRDSGRRFVGIAIKFDVSVHVPKQEKVLSFLMRVEPPETFKVDYTQWDSSYRSVMGKSSAGGGPSDAQVYEVMALRAFDQMSTKLKLVFFSSAITTAKPKPAAKRAPADDDDDE